MVREVEDGSGGPVAKPYKSYGQDITSLTGHIKGGEGQWLLSRKAEDGVYRVTVIYRNGGSVLGPYERKAGSALEAMVAEANSRTKGEEVELMLKPAPEWLESLIAGD